jgi:hypothetical protein
VRGEAIAFRGSELLIGQVARLVKLGEPGEIVGEIERRIATIIGASG